MYSGGNLADVEIAVNKCWLSNVEHDVQLSILTPNLMMYGQPNLLPETDTNSSDETELQKRARYLRRCSCTDVLWSRSTRVYVVWVRKRHNMKHKCRSLPLTIGEWNIGIIVNLVKGRDGDIRATRLRAGKSITMSNVAEI